MATQKPARRGKQLVAKVRLHIGAGDASPKPPIGPMLAPRGVNTAEFCRAFNADTARYEKGMRIPVDVMIYSDRSYEYKALEPAASVLLRQAAGIAKGSATPNTDKVATLTQEQIEGVAQLKQPDLTAAELNAAVRTLAGTARSMGINVEGM